MKKRVLKYVHYVLLGAEVRVFSEKRGRWWRSISLSPHLKSWVCQLINLRKNLETCKGISSHILQFLELLQFSHFPMKQVSQTTCQHYSKPNSYGQKLVWVQFHERNYFEDNLLWAVWEFADGFVIALQITKPHKIDRGFADFWAPIVLRPLWASNPTTH